VKGVKVMTVTIELKPEVENFLRTKASKNGGKVETFIETFIEENIIAQEPRPATKSVTEWREKFDKWIESHKDKDYPVLPDEAYSRENIY
jgi:hypothetical protein